MRRNHLMALAIFGVASGIAAFAVSLSEFGMMGALGVIATALTVIAIIIGNLPDPADQRDRR